MTDCKIGSQVRENVRGTWGHQGRRTTSRPTARQRDFVDQRGRGLIVANDVALVNCCRSPAPCHSSPGLSGPFPSTLRSHPLTRLMFFNQVFKRSTSSASTDPREGELASTATPASEVSSLRGQSSDSSAPSTPETNITSVGGRRTSLPSVMVGDDSSLFKILKNNMGKVRATHELEGNIEQ